MDINNKDAKITTQINIEKNYGNINLSNLGQDEKKENSTIDKEKLRTMIGKNELEEVINILVETYPERNDFITQKRRLTELEDNDLVGIVASSDYRVERGKITMGVLKMITNL